MRNSNIISNYNFLNKSQNWNKEKLLDYQLKKLKAIVFHAYKNSEYYKNKYDNYNFNPDSIISLDDLQRIPTITKEELLNNAQRIQLKRSSEKLFYSETSGSTGRPLVFYRNKDWDAWHRASIFRGYSWYGIKPWGKNGYLWGYNLAFKRRLKIRLLDYLQNRFRLFSYKDKEIDKFANKLTKASFLSGYSSMIYEIAKRINSNKKNKQRFHLKMIKGTSEKIFDIYHEETERAFGQKIISEYGAAEAGIIAFECPNGNMHINMETVIVEEENNEIVVTNLVSNSFPIIRYELGDYIQIDKETRCACGMQHYIIKEIIGRVGKVIYGLKNQYPSLTLYYVFKNLAMEHNIVINYQAVQSQKGFLKVMIENKLNENEKKLLRMEFFKYFENDITIETVENANLKSNNKKKADFISTI
jgi:phenylacetate-CoA ligase